MTRDERMPKWRNALTWTVAAFVAYAGFVYVISAVLEDGMSLAAPVLATTAAALPVR